MKAFVYEFGELKLTEMADPAAGKGEVVVTLKTAGMNRRDLYIPNRRGDHAEAVVLGSDGAGIIESIGEGVEGLSVGDEVIINPSLGWFENSAAPPEGFEIVGHPFHGTFAEKIVISAEQIEKKPVHLNWEQAGVLGLAALTGYRAMFTKGDLKPGETVFIPGVGSGVATFLVKFAKQIGARVIVSSRSEDKRQQAIEKLGADLAIDTHSNWQEVLKDETIDLVIDSVGAATFNRSLSVLKKGGRMVIFGATTEDVVDINLRDFFYGQYQLFGSTMGSRDEFREMLAFIEKHHIVPEIDRVFALEEAHEALKYLEVNHQFGKIALQIDPS